MSALAVTDRRGSTRKPRAHAGHLWPVPAATPADSPGAGSRDAALPGTVLPDAVLPDAVLPDAVLPGAALPGAVAASAPVTVNITIDGTDTAGRERVLAALRELVAVAGGTAEVRLHGGIGAAEAGDTGRPAGIHLEPQPRTVARDGRPLHLSRLEYDLLLFLARHPRQVFSRAQLLTQVWGHTHTTLRTVDVHVSRLRTKLDGQDLITTVYGLGYRLADDVPVTIAG